MMADFWIAVYLFLLLFCYSSEEVTNCPGEIYFNLFPLEICFSFKKPSLPSRNIQR